MRIIDLALLYTMLALGLNIVVSLLGYSDLGYIAFYAVKRLYLTLLASSHFGVHLPWWVLLPRGRSAGGLLRRGAGRRRREVTRRLPRHHVTSRRREIIHASF